MRSALAGLDLALRTDTVAGGVHLGERPPLGKVELRGDARDAGFLRLAQETVGFALPAMGGSMSGGGLTVLGLGPDEWLLLTPPADAAAWAARLEAATAERHGLALDASSAWTVLRIAGPAAVELLAGLVAIDLDPPAFGASHCAATRLGACRAILHQVADPPAFDLYLPRSLARGLWEQITAARPLGIAVVPIPA